MARPDVVVIAECGRWDAGSPAAPLLRAADAVLVLVRPRAEELAHLAAQLPEVARWRGVPGLVLAGRDGYQPDQVWQTLGVPVMAVVPADPHAAGVLHGETGWQRRTGRRPLLRAAARIARTLTADQPHPAGDAAPTDDRPIGLIDQRPVVAAAGDGAGLTNGVRR